MRTRDYLVDASNLGGLLGGSAGARDAPAVVRFLMPWARERRRVRLVFDGVERPDVASRYGGVEVVWSGAEPADETIVRTIAKEPERWIVVTADRELQSRCRGLGVRCETAAHLAGTVRRPQPRRPRSARAAEAASDKPPAHAEERDHWRRIFAGEDDESQR